MLHLSKRHFNALDLSRLIAAFAVLFWHYQHFFVPPVLYEFHVRRSIQPLYHPLRWFYDYGHIAVEYFWAVSGFVFAHVYLGNVAARARFWIARFARLWPLHLITLVAVALLQGIYTARHGVNFIYHHQDVRHFLLNLAMAHYWGFQANQSFNGPSWSLSTEIVAYALFWSALPALRRHPVIVAGAIATLAFAAMFGDVLPPDAPQATLTARVVSVVACLGYFFAGVAAYAALAAGAAGPRRLLAVALVLAAAAWRLAMIRHHGFDMAMLAATFAALGVVVALDLADTRDRLAPLRPLGDASYGVYLWHFPVQLVFVIAVDAAIGTRWVFRDWWMLALFLVAALAAGFASHRWIERPAQRAILRLARRDQSTSSAMR